MPDQISTAVTYGLLAGTSIYCLKTYGTGDWKQFPVGSYGVVAVNSVLGLCYYAIDKISGDIEKPFHFTQVLNTCIPLPLIVTQAWLNYGYKKEFAWAHGIIGCIPLLQYLADKENKDFQDLIIACCCISLGYVTAVAENYYGLGSAVAYLMSHFYVQKCQDMVDLPALDIYNIGLCVFCFLSLYAIGSK